MSGTELPLSAAEVDAFVRATLAEDLGTGGDVTSRAVVPETARLQAVMATREQMVVSGLPLAVAFFRALDPDCTVVTKAEDGDRLEPGQELMVVVGNGRALLTAERSALNTVQHLSGIATLTRQYVDMIEGTGAVLLDTRKTLPGLRLLEKYATRCGGAQNHRLRLDDGILIKDNHIAIVGSIEAAVKAAKEAGTGLQVQVEVDTLAQIAPALEAGADRLLLDNMSPDTLRAAVEIVGGRVPLEASGGVNLATIRGIAETGVDYISVGRITQSAPAVDIGLDFLAA
ncbi:carboxylating nicotinate-nucleotide diphosphorylase [Pedomonas mirosovicensis]|uniref:carboxylating nicotinate-nucleotide diphosphorylase n=1 Tax=Pedomonas mirosovicensis TaxID=2908641 RepID=UPI002168F148|nr:carboxylating nicotinate-nucleotide diphosphorylase [Pedomonas mirosovicensis]MCH8684742.1 carboxylating nicotinate-nucleotide diphosphorylase [Pedomonas mirosovicensis]